MKELSIEEKAKHYNEAIERARVVYTYYCDDREQLRKIEFIFPELKESEDERMRAMAIKAIRIPEARSCIKNWGINPDDVIAWLEKQGNKDEEILVLKDQIESLHAAIKAIKETHRIELEKQKDPKYLDPSTCEPWSDEQTRRNLINFLKNLGATELPQASYNRYLSYLEKQGEQNPKFRVGDTIKCKHDDRRFTIKSINLDKGTYTYTQEGCGNDIDYADKEFELVEYNPADKIEHEIEIPFSAKDSELQEATYYIPKGFHAEIEDDKVVIKKGEKSAAWSEDDEKELCRVVYMMEQLDLTESWSDCYIFLNSLKDRVQQQPQQKWSEEDEKRLRGVITMCDIWSTKTSFYPKESNDIENLKNWLKSLKDRVLPQPKQEWSEEDEKIQSWIIEYVNNLPLFYAEIEIDGEDISTKEYRDKVMSWLKSLRPQNTWKPSESDILLLERIAYGKSNPQDFQASLGYLIEQLKKLRVE